MHRKTLDALLSVVGAMSASCKTKARRVVRRVRGRVLSAAAVVALIGLGTLAGKAPLGDVQAEGQLEDPLSSFSVYVPPDDTPPVDPAEHLKQLAAREQALEFAPQFVIPPDERVRRTPTTTYPASAITFIAIQWKDGTYGACSGVLVGPNAVLTAAHCLYSARRGGYAAEVVVAPGLDTMAVMPYGVYRARARGVPNGFIVTGSGAYDVGMIVLDEPAGALAGHMRIGVLTDLSLASPAFNPHHAGYPGDKPQGTQWWTQKPRFLSVGPDLLGTDMDMYQGQSGGPVWRAADGAVVALVSFESYVSGLNYVKRITGTNLAALRDFCSRTACSFDAFEETVPPPPPPPPATPTPTPPPPPTATPTPPVPRNAPRLPAMTTTLSWAWPAGATLYHLQVVPAYGDGPGVDVIRGQETSFTLPPPPMWYGLLPDMGYTWRIRFSSDGATWADWAYGTPFRTPVRTSEGIRAVQPSAGVATNTTPVLVWTDTYSDVFYYELQLSADPTFNMDPATATSAVYTALIHGGATVPPNSYQVPASAPLSMGPVYYWRVRPRVQGDGAPVPWSATFQLAVRPETPTPAPTATPTASPTPTAVPVPSSYSLVFSSNRDGNYELYAVRGDGSLLRRITANEGQNLFPAVAPDGRRLALISTRRTGREVVWVTNADGTDPRMVGSDAGSDGPPRWSPSGSRIAYANESSIWLANPDGSDRTYLAPSAFRAREPAWSPIGDRIAFTSAYSGDDGIWMQRVEGTAPVRVADWPGSNENQPAWSSSGHIAFVSDVSGQRYVYTIRPDGGEQRVLTTATGPQSQPTWSPDGRRLAFVANEGGQGEVYVVNADGSGLTNVSRHPADDTSPAWSPDGRHIAFVSYRDGRPQVYVAAADGSGPLNVSNGPAVDRDPVWLPR